ncbi:MAG: LemA family protein [Bacilli bacterium]|jgi:LemA protein
MKKILGIVLGAVGLLAVIFGVMTAIEYNALATKHESVAYQKSQIVNSLETRDSTLGQLVVAVEAAIDIETSVYEMITNARESFATASSGEDYAAIIEADQLSALAITELYAVIEDNPDLQSIDTIEGLMVTIESLENQLKVARTDYNTAVRDYNTSIRTFPRNMFAAMFKFESSMPYWSANPETGDGEIVVSGISYNAVHAS